MILIIWSVERGTFLFHTLSFCQQMPGDHFGKDFQALVDVAGLTVVWNMIGLDKRTDFRVAPVDEGTTSIEYGAYTVGRVPNDRVSEVKDLFLNLMSEVITREEQDEMSRLFIVLDQLKRKLHDELLVVILCRVVPGRCRYCPI